MKARRFVKSFATQFMDDNVPDAGAMMAYYAVMALFPMLIFVLSLALLVIPTDTVRQGLAMATETMPPSVRDVIAGRVDALIHASGAGFAILGVVVALWSASRGAVSLMAALNTVYNKKETRSWLRRQLIAIGVTVAVALIAVVALALLVAGPYVGAWLGERYGLGAQFDTIWNIGRWVGAGVLVMFVWAIAYKFLPNTDAPFRVFTPGAVIGVLLWLGISALFGLYLSHFNSYEATYGTLGGAIIFLTWPWLSN
ncbi:MAG TPA: YihY/virulence factor BrkB family protein, partial [Kofleriaceae bacterium]|nr:YihY/virulence factor BrkB family protein [Kofleriaceae bacterium]